MLTRCPYCLVSNALESGHPRIVRTGWYKRKSDLHSIQRYRCLICEKGFSSATLDRCLNQNKRHLNPLIRELFASGISLRRLSRLFSISRTTSARKLKFLGSVARENLNALNLEKELASSIQFDDLETIEHTKMKPVSVTLAVETKTRRILGFEVAKMPAKGLLANRARKKYGNRIDEREFFRRKLFSRLQGLVLKDAEIHSDENPHYLKDVREFFPHAIHVKHKGKRGSTTGQGELKATRFDPLFSLNHTCAMFRYCVNRLFRKTWCTTKSVERLKDHLAIYADYHNSALLKNPSRLRTNSLLNRNRHPSKFGQS
jgi:transposase-like protein